VKRIFGAVAVFAMLMNVARADEPARYDVVVYSGVPCGLAASVAAARNGASVLLIEPTKHVGGLSTSGINTAETEHMLKWTFGGIALEFYDRLGKHYGTGKPEFYFESSVAEKVYLDMLKEANVTVRYGVRVERVVRDGKHLRRIELSDGSAVEAKVFVDAGYEGDLMARAGVTYTWGRESKAEFGEEAAGIRFDKTPRQAATVDAQGNLLPGISAWAKDLKEGDGDKKVMNYNFRLCASRSADNKTPIPPPEHYDRNRYKLLENYFVEYAGKKLPKNKFFDAYKRRGGKYELNNQQNAIISLGHFGGQFGWPDGSYADRDRIFADHKDYTLGLLHFLRTEPCVPKEVRDDVAGWGLAKNEFADNGNFPYQLYVREARRMRGAYVMTQKDVQDHDARRKDDAIGISSHFIDSHHVERVALSPTEFVNEGRIWRIGYAYQIPYRSLTPKADECDNLLVPGAASFTHVAFCTYRLESVWMIAGHAAGTAAAQASKAGGPVQALDLEALQRRLRAEKQVVDFVPGAPERFQGGAGADAEF
jgi:FAD dependent oxidoreductase